jgi:hypothetical protein
MMLRLLAPPARPFCRLNPVRFGTDPAVVDLKKVTFRPAQPPEFREGRLCLFRAEEGWLDKQLQQLHITLPMAGLAYLILHNPFYLALPASLPLMCCLELVLVRLYYLRHRNFLHKVGAIHLLDDGHTVEVSYLHAFPRRIRDLPLKRSLYVPDLSPVPGGENDPPVLWEYPRWPRVGWTRKYFLNRDNYLNLPAKHSKHPLLEQVLAGVSIDLS